MADCKQQLLEIGVQAGLGRLYFMTIFRLAGVYHAWAQGYMNYVPGAEGPRYLYHSGTLTSVMGDIVTSPPFQLAIFPDTGAVWIDDPEHGISTTILSNSANCEGDASSLHLTGQEEASMGEWITPLPVSSIRLLGMHVVDFLASGDKLKNLEKQLSAKSA
jgi:hypothetical protein